MRRKLSAVFIILFAAVMLIGCQPASKGGEILDSSFKLIAEKKTPSSGTPDDFSPIENLAFAAYKFNHASSWESEYNGIVTAVGTNQKVKNIRKFDGDAIFAQAVSYSNLKSVAEQKFFRGDKIFVRKNRGKIDNTDLTTTWSTKISEIKKEEFYRDYGAIPNEIFKFSIDESTVLSAQKTESTIPDAYAYRLELSAESAQYIKNEVRTLAGSKSDPKYKSIECVFEIDKDWNILRTSGKEKYDVAILGGVTCTSTYTEDFKLNSPVTIAEKALFETFIPSDETEDPELSSLDYLSLAFTNLAVDDKFGLKAKIGDVDATVNIDLAMGKFAFKIGDVVIKNGGQYLYILGEQNAKIKLLSLYQAVFDLSTLMPEDDIEFLPDLMPELSALVDELKVLLGVKENGDEESSSIISSILDGIDEPIKTGENSVTINIHFTIDGTNFSASISVKDKKLDRMTAQITYLDKKLDIELSPSDEIITASENDAHEISGVVETIGALAKKDPISFRCEDMLLSLYKNGEIIINAPSLNLGYSDEKFKLNIGKNHICFDAPPLDIVPKDLSDILGVIEALKNSVNVSTKVEDESVSFILDIDGEQVQIDVNSGSVSPITVNAYNKTLTLCDEVASIDDNAEYINANKLGSLLKRIISDKRLDLNVKANILGIEPDITLSLDFNDKTAIAKTGDTVVTVSDAVYITNDKVRGKFSFDALFSSQTSQFPSFDFDYIKEFLNKPLTETIGKLVEMSDDFAFSTGDDGELIIGYSGVHGDMTISVNATIDDEISASVTVTKGDNTYSATISEGLEVLPVNTDGCIVLDPIAYTIKEFSAEMPVFDVTIQTNDGNVSAYVMPDLEGGGLIANIGNVGIYIYDKIYVSNQNGCYSFSKETASDIASLFDTLVNDFLPSQVLDLSIFEENDLLTVRLGLERFDIKFDFDKTTSFFDEAIVEGDGFKLGAKISSVSPLTRPELDDISVDAIVNLVSSAKSSLSSKTLTIDVNSFVKESGLNINGFLSFERTDDGENLTNLALEVNIAKTETHTIKARLQGDNVTAYYVYGGKSTAIELSKDNLLAIAFKIADILGLDIGELEKFRPALSEPISSEIIYNALPRKFKEFLEKPFGSAPTPDKFLDYLEHLDLHLNEGEVYASLSDSAYFTAKYSPDELRSVELSSDTLNAKLEFSTSFKDIEDETAESIDLNKFNDLLKSLINTVNLGEYKISGAVTLSVLLAGKEYKINDMNFELTAKIDDNKTPYVYAHISVPYTPVVLTKAESYLFFYDDTIYLKSERYIRRLLAIEPEYSETLYKKCTPQEFGDNLIDNLFFLIPLSEPIQKNIKDSSSQSPDGEKSYAEVLTSFGYDEKEQFYETTIDLNKLTGKDTLDVLNLKLGVRNNLLSSLSLSTKLSIVALKAEATLSDYDGTIVYGLNSENFAGDLLDMPQKLNELEADISDWRIS